ncbi:hypothetical protein FU139_26885 [Burkholderia territorii]|nr:hypothetical protein FU139_26885 [Burkholderia territorii]
MSTSWFLSRLDRCPTGSRKCAPACIVGVKVTSHIGRKTTGGDLFLTICDYRWKPLRVGNGLCSGGLRRIPAERGLSGCGVPDAAERASAAMPEHARRRCRPQRWRAGARRVIAALRRRFPGRSRAAPGRADRASAHAIRRSG